MMVDNGNTKNLLISLPQDVEALVLLYSEDNKNVSSERLCTSKHKNCLDFFKLNHFQFRPMIFCHSAT